MKRLFVLMLAVCASTALAQPKQMPPMKLRPGEAVPAAVPAAAPVAPGAAAPVSPGATIAPKKPSCEETRRKGKYNIYFDKVEIEKLVQTVSDVTCKTFILPENIRGKISIIGPENGKVEVDADQFYAAFLAALDANSLSLYQNGKFLKIVDKQRAKQFPIPTITDSNEPYTLNEQMLTRIFKVKNVEIEQLRGVLQQLVTPSGDTIPFQPDTIIINDLGSNMHRLERVIEQLDTRAGSDEVKVLQIQYATAQEIADKITKLFEVKNARPGQRPGSAMISMPPPPSAPGAPAATPADAPGASGPASLSQLIPDERTNKLIVIASPAGMERILALIREIDIPVTAGAGKINVYYLENANAEDVASTLQTLAQGSANRPKTGAPPPPPGGSKGGAAELFSGEVKVSADKATNALVIIASQSDYQSLIRVIEKLDIQRRQVFVEAVIMEVNLDRNAELGINLHGGIPLNTDQGSTPIFFGTKYSKGSGLPPSISATSLLGLSGFLAGIQGAQKITIAPGIEVPAFGLAINALQTSSDVNVLSTPHILTTDNEEAEITVGQNVPFQSGFSTGFGGLSGLSGLSGLAGGSSALSGLSGLSGLGGSPVGQIQRQNVDLKLSIKPQINESDFVRLVISEQIEEIASQDPVLGPTTSKRSAKTTVIAKDQETVVIGGIMQDRLIESVSKIPVLGDIPIVGNLFRQQSRKKVKTNLLLFLTPYIIRESADFRRIFERKMRERQQFVEQFYGATTQYDVSIDFTRKAGPLARMAQVMNKEMNRYENGGTGNPGEKLISPTPPANPAVTPAKDDQPGTTYTPVIPPTGAKVKEPSIETLSAQPVQMQ